MSGSVDDEVVRMRFDNNAFERGVAATLSTLSKLKNALTFSGADKGLDNVEAKANKFSLAGMSNGIDGVSKKFLALSTVAITALSNITNRAVNAGIALAKSFTIAPIKAGFESYETQINAAQTIMANTGASLPTVEGQLKQLQVYAQQTVYNFADMANAIGTFTAAGVKLGPATQSIKGLGNAAALSGVDATRLSGAYQQVSQALATGVFKLQDWKSVQLAGLGGSNIQNALKSTADTIKGSGPAMDKAIKKYGSFNASLTSGWLTGDIFNKTMSVMAGKIDKATGKTVAYSVAELEAKGYTKAHAIELNKLSTQAIKSATEIRTYTQLTSALKEEVAGAYGNVFKAIFGNLDSATVLFTGLHNAAENALTNPINDFAKLLEAANKLGARTKLIEGFTNILRALGAIIKPIKAAFRDLFPKQTAAGLAALITKFDNFTKKLIIGGHTAGSIFNIFRGLFAVFDIGKQIVAGVFHVFASLFGSLTKGSGGILKFAANIGLMLYNFDQALKQSDSIHNIFSIIASSLQIPINLLRVVGTLIGGVFKKFDLKKATGFTNSLGNTGGALEHAAKVMKKFSNVTAGFSSHITPAINAIANAFSHIGAAISQGLGSAQFSNILKTVQVGLLGALALMFKKFFSGGGLSVDLGNGAIGKIGEAFDALTSKTKAMTQNVKADTLEKIAIAVGILAASMVALSFVNSEKLKTALAAMAAGFGELLGAMAVLIKISGSTGIAKIPIIAAAMNLLALAILTLSVAVIALSLLSYQQLAKGLGAVIVLLAALSLAALAMSANSAGLLSASISIGILAVSMNLLFIAVKAFSTLSYAEMLKGLGSVIAILVALSITMRALPEQSMLRNAAALLLIALAMDALYLAVKKFASLSYGALTKGLLAITVALRGIAFAMDAMPRGMIAQAIALTILAGALLLLDKAVAQMGKLGFGTIVKGIAGIAGVLTVLAIALNAMDGAIPGALALIVAAKGISILVTSLVALSKLSIGEIVKSLLTLVATLAIVGGASLLLAPLLPEMLALGVALGLIGVAMLAFGAGAALLGIGLTAIAAVGGAAIGIIISAIQSLIGLLPSLVTAIATAFVQFVTIIGGHAPQIVGALVSILNQLLQAIPKIIPSLIVAINALVVAILSVLTTNAPKIIAAGLALLLDLLKGIRDNIGQIVNVVAAIIVNFLNALANNIGKIINAGVNLLTKLLVGIASALGKMPSVVLKVVAAFLTALVGNLPKLVSMGVRMLGSVVTGISGAVGRMGGAALTAVRHFVSGLGGDISGLIRAGSSILGTLVGAINDGVTKMFNGGIGLAAGIVNGLIKGIENLASTAYNKIKKFGSGLLSTAKDIIGIPFGSPSKEFIDIGENIAIGTAVGVDNAAPKAVKSVENMGARSVNALKKTVAGLTSIVSDANLDYTPTVAPILDLNQFKKDATAMSNLVTVAPVNAALSYNQAAGIAGTQQAQADAAQNVDTTPPVVNNNVSYEQNLYSPKAISTADNYRATKNLLSQKKIELGLTAAG